jgi:hypothetical protein
LESDKAKWAAFRAVAENREVKKFDFCALSGHAVADSACSRFRLTPKILKMGGVWTKSLNSLKTMTLHAVFPISSNVFPDKKCEHFSRLDETPP